MIEKIPQKDIRKLKEITRSFKRSLISKKSKSNKTSRIDVNDHDHLKFNAVKVTIKEFGYGDIINMFDQLSNTPYPTLHSVKDRIETIKENPQMLKQTLINARARTMAGGKGRCKGNRQTLRRTVRKTRRLQIKKKNNNLT
jgi:hypothetical protein